MHTSAGDARASRRGLHLSCDTRWPPASSRTLMGPMRLQAIAIAAALSAGFAPQKGAERPIVSAGRAPRTVRTVGWSTFAQGPLAGWRVQWDKDTDVPVRMFGPGVTAPGAMANRSVAEAAAHAFLAAHLDVLAPGASIDDFVLVADEVNPWGDVRTVAYAQHAS